MALNKRNGGRAGRSISITFCGQRYHRSGVQRHLADANVVVAGSSVIKFSCFISKLCAEFQGDGVYILIEKVEYVSLYSANVQTYDRR